MRDIADRRIRTLQLRAATSRRKAILEQADADIAAHERDTEIAPETIVAAIRFDGKLVAIIREP